MLINIKLTKERTSKYIQINIQTDVAMEKVKNELIECDLYGKLDTCISADIIPREPNEFWGHGVL